MATTKIYIKEIWKYLIYFEWQERPSPQLSPVNIGAGASKYNNGSYLPPYGPTSTPKYYFKEADSIRLARKGGTLSIYKVSDDSLYKTVTYDTGSNRRYQIKIDLLAKDLSLFSVYDGNSFINLSDKQCKLFHNGSWISLN